MNIPKSRKSKLIERKINQAIEDFRLTWDWSWDVLGMKLDEEPASIKRYVQQDRCEITKVSKIAKSLNWPFFTLQEVSTGAYVSLIKDWLLESDLTVRQLVKTTWPKFSSEQVERYKIRTDTAFSTKQMSAFMAASYRKSLGRKCFDPLWLLNNDEKKEFMQ